MLTGINSPRLVALPGSPGKMRCVAVEQTWLDEEPALKAAALKGVGGSSPSCSAISTGMCLQPLSREFVEYSNLSTVALAAAVYIPVISLIVLACWLTIPL